MGGRLTMREAARELSPSANTAEAGDGPDLERLNEIADAIKPPRRRTLWRTSPPSGSSAGDDCRNARVARHRRIGRPAAALALHHGSPDVPWPSKTGDAMTRRDHSRIGDAVPGGRVWGGQRPAIPIPGFGSATRLRPTPERPDRKARSGADALRIPIKGSPAARSGRSTPGAPDNSLPPGTIVPPLPPDLDLDFSGKAYLSVNLVYQGQRHHHHRDRPPSRARASDGPGPAADRGAKADLDARRLRSDDRRRFTAGIAERIWELSAYPLMMPLDPIDATSSPPPAGNPAVELPRQDLRRNRADNRAVEGLDQDLPRSGALEAQRRQSAASLRRRGRRGHFRARGHPPPFPRPNQYARTAPKPAVRPPTTDGVMSSTGTVKTSV